MQIKILILILLIVSIPSVHAIENSRWLLTISGFDKLEFGTEKLAGGLNIEWKTLLEFSVRKGQFKVGTGKAEFIGDITGFSRPAEMFDCQLMNGTFSNRNGMSFSTPHLRYKSFPVTGRVIGNTIQLNPFLEYPGNYYAVLYRCKTANDLGAFWIDRSPRVARELSKRQNTITKLDEGIYQAEIKEVKSIPPGPEIEMQLIDGLKFSVTEQFGLRKLEYTLKRIIQD